jgi:phage protein D
MAALSYTLDIAGSAASAEVVEAIQELEVDDSMDRASAFRVRMAIGSTTTGGWDLLDKDLFHPLTPVTVRLDAGQGPGQLLIRGYVTAANVILEEDPGASSLEVVGVDATARMNLEVKIRPWPNLPDSTIAEKIFDEHKLKPRVTPTSPSRSENEETTIQRTTDIRFLRFLASRNGYACYVETDPGTGVETGVFAPLDLAAKVQGVLSVRFGEATNVERFTARYEMLRPTAAESFGLGIAARTVESSKASSASETLLGRNGTLDEIKPVPLVRPSGTGLNDAGELKRYSQGVTDRSTWAVVATGSLHAAAYGKALRARRPVNVRGAGDLYNGTYLVRRVVHTFESELYRQQFELTRNALRRTGSESFTDTAGLAPVR